MEMPTVCDGLSVIEMGSMSIPASLAGVLLGDNGARVVKMPPRRRTRSLSAPVGECSPLGLGIRPSQEHLGAEAYDWSGLPVSREEI
jgi:hypothetical protein